MRSLWVSALGIGLGVWLGNARSQEPISPGPAATLGRPMAATLGRPVAADQSVRTVSYDSDSSLPPIFRCQAPEPAPPPGSAIVPPPPGAPVGPPAGSVPLVPGATSEPYNCGVVTQPPAAAPGGGFWQSCRDWLHGCKNLFSSDQTTGTRCKFQSDHCFDMFASPITNPFLFEDPRALTEIKPLFIFQGAPSDNWIYHGGNSGFAGIQARLAVTERLSFVMSELGFVWSDPYHPPPVDDFGSHAGFAEVRVGPKYTFIRNENTGTLLAAGVNFDIAAGDHSVHQDTDSLSVEPYISFGQNFWRTSYGSANFLNTTGFSGSGSNERSDFFFSSFHFDYDIANLHKLYPVLEINYFYYTAAGNELPLGFEGRDLINFGSKGVSGNNSTTIAPGFRYKFNENFQTGIAVEFPLGGHKDLIDYRVTWDFIFRY